MNQVIYNLATHKPTFFSVVFTLVFTLTLSCNQSGSSNSQQRNIGNTDRVNGSGPEDEQNTIRTDGNSDSAGRTGIDTRIYLSPFEARAVVDREVSLGDSYIIENFKVPRLKLTFDKADFVQVLRCAASRKMETLTGEDVRHLAGRPGQQSELEWAWAVAVEDRRKCKWVGKKIVSRDFPDLTAPKGEYYYVINPCVLSENSVLKKEGCSFNLTLTYPVTVTNSFKEEVRQKNIELAQAEGSLNANLLAAQHLAKKIDIHLTACENMVAKDKALNDFKKGLVQFGALAVGGAIGGLIGGPNGAVMLGQMASAFGGAYIYTSVLGLPSDVVNECIDPTVVATTEEQRKEASKADKRYNPIEIGETTAANDAGQRGKYEEEYQVQALTRQLQAILGPEGPIAQDTLRVQTILQELFVLDLEIVTLDKSYAEAANLGIDVNDISTFP